MSFFTVGWQAPANIGWLPQHPGDGGDPFFVVGWAAKQSATYYPFDGGELSVPPGGSDTPVEASPAPAAPSPALAPRSHAAQAYVGRRKDPALFRRQGLAVQLALPAPATVTLALVASSGHRKLSYEQTLRLPAGTAHLRLHASAYGKLLTRHHEHVAARLEVGLAYTDGARASLARSVTLARAPG
jgi:hypothetical protein